MNRATRHRSLPLWHRVGWTAFAALGLHLPAAAYAAEPSPSTPVTNLGDLSIEQLLNLEVTTVSRNETRLNRAPAAVAVLTGEDIRESGATSIPEALRAVPGLDVARISANRWGISSRGFNDEYANKLLVLADGRTVYTPSFGGVYWNTQDMLLEDIDRIEVIRGPGGSLWGANAVNGVINIISKPARETQGVLLSGTYGSEDQPSTSLRYGGRLGADCFYRVHGKYFDRAGFENSAGNSMSDDWEAGRGGFRLDWEPESANRFTLLADYYEGTHGEEVVKGAINRPAQLTSGVSASMHGADILGRWTRQFSEGSELKLQVSFDHYFMGQPFGGMSLDPVVDLDAFLNSGNQAGEWRDTGDADLQYSVDWGARQTIVCGAGYRYTEDRLDPRRSELSASPSSFRQNLVSGFVQDQISLVPERLTFTLGSKLEHNDFTGWEYQPSARLLWAPSEKQSIWAATSRAVRTPTRMERDVRANFAILGGVPPVQVALLGDDAVRSETLLAYEIGYRIEPTSDLSFDVTGFFNDYDRITAWVQGTPGFEPDAAGGHVLAPYLYANAIDASTYGIEGLARWQVASTWRLTAGCTWLRHESSGAPLVTGSPDVQLSLRSTTQLPAGFEINAALYSVAGFTSSTANLQTVHIPGFLRADFGLGWHARKHFSVELWCQNALDDRHPEFAGIKTTSVGEIPRTFYARLTWRY
jgi:iron complex outermembrane receptor protein